MHIEPDLWEPEELALWHKNIKAILTKELITHEYTTEGDTIRKMFALPLDKALELVESALMDKRNQGVDTSVTVPVFGS